MTEVAPGILRMQLPIMLTGLGHVNCYAMEDSKGWTIVDPGLPGPKTMKALKQRLGQAGGRLKDVHTVIVTHSHPDHFGTAGYIRQHHGAQVVAHERFRTWFDPEEADARVGRISYNSPLGRALIGREVGDEVEVTTPAGDRYYEVAKIEFI